jgi:PKD repeat protein
MKKTLPFFFIVFALLLQTQLLAGTVVVKGTVKDSLNHPVANKSVKIYTTDSAGGCVITHTIITNPNGYYIDTLNCNVNINKVFVAVENCNGARIIHDPNVGLNNVVESNFVICVTTPAPPAPTCNAIFTFIQAATGIKFTAGASSAPSGDSITSYTWSFGDSTARAAGTKDPLHVYTSAGTYTVCVTIKTKKGCESNYCKTVVFAPQVSCKATAAISAEKIAPKKFRFNSAQSATLAGDSIFERIWQFSDGTSLDGNRTIAEKEFKDTGVFTVCLKVVSKKGCDNRTCITITVRDTIPPPPSIPTNCKAAFSYTMKVSTIRFNSAASIPSSAAGDSIISRTWLYSDSVNNVSLNGNVVDPSYVYTKPGAYKVTLVIKTKAGCESKVTVLVVVPAPPPPVACKASFVFTVEKGSVKFKSTSTGTTALDSLISYTWIFGDSTVPVQGGKDPLHVYAKSGKYTVMLYIKTKSGCESKYTETVAVTLAPPVNCAADVQFTAERVSVKKVQFNSSMSKTNAGDSIIQRNWKFGDNTMLGGNEVKPVKEFPVAGIYNTCLEIKTANGCIAQTCKQVTVQDTVSTPQSTVDFIKIVSINPNPVITRMMATIYSRNTNAETEIIIYDIYGTPKMTIKKLLAQGNNVIEINLGNLYRGPYYLKASTKSGRDAKAFYKL